MIGKYICMGLLALSCSQVFAAYRLWEGKDGSAIEAEFVSESGSHVVLRRRDKSITRVPKDKLSSRDVRYVEMKNPPRLKIHLDVLGRLGQKGCDITITKTVSDAYDAPIIIQLFVVGYNRLSSEELVLIDSMKWSYNSLPKGKFSDSRNYERGYESLSSYVDDRYRHVQLFEVTGYVIKVFDAKGSLVAMEESESRLNKEAERAMEDALENVKINSANNCWLHEALRTDIKAAKLGHNRRGGACISLFSSTQQFSVELQSKKITCIEQRDGSDWTEMPETIDAAFSYYDERFSYADQTTYLFGDGECWKYRNANLTAHNRIGKKPFKGISDEIEATAYVVGDGLYIFSSRMCYLYNLDQEKVIKVIPFSSDHWPGIPEEIEAAVGFRSNIFFFTEGKFYYYSPKEKAVLEEGYISFPGFVPPVQEFQVKQQSEKSVAPAVSVKRKDIPKIPLEQIAPTLDRIIEELAVSQKKLGKLEGELAVKLTVSNGKSMTGNMAGIDGKWIEFKAQNSTRPIRFGSQLVKRIDFKIRLDVKKIQGPIDQRQYDALSSYLDHVLTPYLPYKELRSNLNEIISFSESLKVTLEQQ